MKVASVSGTQCIVKQGNPFLIKLWKLSVRSQDFFPGWANSGVWGTEIPFGAQSPQKLPTCFESACNA